MIADIIAVFFIVSGAFFLFFPGALRWSLKRRAKRRIRRYCFALAISAGILLISEGWRYPGVLPKILVLAGLAVMVKGLFYLKAKTTDKTTEWIASRPLWFFKVFAACQIAAGFAILFGLER